MTITSKSDTMIGRPVLRVEDQPLLLGRAEFLDDVPIPDVLHAAYVRSQVAHGIIRRVATDHAAALEGVVAVFTGADLADIPDLVAPVAGAVSPPRRLLASDRVRYVGEPVAVVVATSLYIAEDAAGLVEVDVDLLEPVTTMHEALDPAKPVLHESAECRTNVLFERVLEAGEPDAVFASAPIVVERLVRHPRVAASPMEGRGAAAYLEDGELTLWSSTQFPHALRDVVSQLFGYDNVRVRCPDIGGGFGLKSISFPEEMLVAWLAVRLRRPVKWVEDRWENLVASAHARDMEVRFRAAADLDGTLLALEVDSLCNVGAYPVYPITHVLESMGVVSMSPGPYRLANYRATARAVTSTTCPSGPYRGVGLPVSTLVHERAMDVLASEVGISPAEIRRRNLIRADELPYRTVTNQLYDSGDYIAALEVALEMIGYDDFEAEQQRARAEGQEIGIGLASYVEWTGNNSKLFRQRGMSALKGWDSCQVSLGPDGRLSVWTSSPAIGQGTATTYAQVLADTTGIDFADIEVLQSDTGSGDVDGTGTGSSRSAAVTSGAVATAGWELRRRLLEDAAEVLGVAAEDLELDGSVVSVRSDPDSLVTVGKLAENDTGKRYTLGRTYEAEHVLYSYATHACRVAIDPDTGGTTVLDYVIAEDCGRVINPLVVEGQTKGGLAQGIAAALYESFIYDQGAQPQSASFMDYLIPTACELPSVRIRHLEIPAPNGIIGAKGVGEGGTIAAGAAIANAVSNALGQECNSLPMMPEELFFKIAALKAAG
jgi:carbon-monoxide dehydrogenase large subunit